MPEQSTLSYPAAGHHDIRLQTDTQGIILSVDISLPVLTGRSRQDLMTHPLKKICTPSSARKLTQWLAARKFNSAQTISLTIKGANGQHTIPFTVIRKKNTTGNKRIVLQWKGKVTTEPVHQDDTFHRFADHLPGMIWVSDEQDNTIYLNKSLMQFTGFTVQDITNDGWTSLIHPDDIPVAIDGYRISFQKREPATLEYRFKRSDGEFRWVIDHSVPRFHANGQFMGYIGSVLDIHHRKKQDELLALEKKVLEMNAQPALSLKTIMDYFLEGLEHFFPGMLCSVLALDDDRVSVHHLSAPSLPSEYAAALKGAKIGPKAGSCGTAMYRKEPVITVDILEDPLWEDYRQLAMLAGLRACWSFPILNAQQEVLATIATYYRTSRKPTTLELQTLERVRDLLRIIIENRQADKKIRMNHERYLLVTKATNDAIWDWDVANSLYWGEGFYTLFGYKPGLEKNGFEKWAQHIHGEDRERVLQGLHQYVARKNAEVWEDEYRFQKANGEYALVLDRGFLIFDHEGKVNRMVGSMQDITEKRGMEKQLLKQEVDKQKQIAQAVVNAQEKERAEIGKELHDNVNQILTTAKLYLELAGNDDAELRVMLQRSADSISDAINEVRNISRSLVPASVGDLGLIDTIHDLVENIKATKKLKVFFRYQGDVDRVMDDKRKLMLFRIIQEQVNNVLKHANATNLTIELTTGEHMIELSIRDDGSGFEPSKVRSKKGTGLSNINSRAELFNGKVTIDTAPGAGCTLNIRIPI